MKRILKLGLTSVALAALVVAPIACRKQSQAGGTIISILAPAQVNTGQSFSVNISVNPGQAIAGL